jgi:hypothetical protein
MLMTQKAHAEGMRALVLYTAWVQDQVQLHPDDDAWKRRSGLLLPLVKGYCSEKAYELLSMSLQVLGGSGYTQDYPMEQYIRDARIDTIYEGTTGIQALDLFFRKIARDQGATAALASEIVGFVQGRTPAIGQGAWMLAAMLDDTQPISGRWWAPRGVDRGRKEEIYKVGLHTNHLLESMAETVIAWLLLRHAEIAVENTDDEPFYVGKVESARWFVRHASPKAAIRSQAAAAEDGTLMDLPIEAF